MTRDDEPTQPLPVVDGAAPGTGPTEPFVAPHVPVADLGTAHVEPIVADAPVRPRRRAAPLLLVGLAAAAVTAIVVFALLGLPRGPALAPVESTSPPAAPSPSVPPAEPDDPPPAPAPAPDPPAPAPEEPVPEPTPPVEPTPEPTPTTTP